MEEQALSATLKAFKKGQCIAILDSESKKAETDLFFPITFLFPLFSENFKDSSKWGLGHFCGS
jgi:3,4-dihydroxy-2-butanone 4-phosphate synthase